MPRDRFGNLHRRLALLKDENDAYAVGGAVLDMVALELMAGFYQTVRGPRNLTEFVERCRRGGSVGAALASLIEAGSWDGEGHCVPLLPIASAADWAASLGGMPDEIFRKAPTWQGEPMETGSLAAHPARPLVAMLLGRGHRIAARLFARVMELSDCASRLRHSLAPDLPALVDAAPLGPGMGISRVETAPRRVAACRPARGRDDRGLCHHPAQPVELPSARAVRQRGAHLAGPESRSDAGTFALAGAVARSGQGFQRHTSGSCQCMRMRSGRQMKRKAGAWASGPDSRPDSGVRGLMSAEQHGGQIERRIIRVRGSSRASASGPCIQACT